MTLFRLDERFLREVAPRFSATKGVAQDRIIAAIAPVFAETLAAAAIDTRLRVAHFTAQVAHECAGFRTTEELASGAAYEGRADLGNRWPGDGVRFKGRGLLQLTGRANYRRMGERLGLPLEEQPTLAADPVPSLRIACAYWSERRVNDPADADDLEAVTRRINGGLNGLEARRALLERAKAALVGCLRSEEAAIRRGSTGEAVLRLQAALRHKGFPLTLDGSFGTATEAATRSFQAAEGLSADGVAGERTWAALGNG